MPAPKARPAKTPAGASVLETLFAASSIVAVAVDAAGKVVLWNRAAQEAFGVPAAKALGKPLAKAVGAAVAGRLEAARAGQGTGLWVPLEMDGGDGPLRLDVECVAAPAPAAALFLGTRASAAPREPAGEPIVRVRPRHATAESRLVEQENLNEELQSRNEELETVNEELQSLNDEMAAMDAEMRGLVEESRRANDFLRLLLDTATNAFIACDADNRVVLWNKAAVKRFRLSSLQAVGGDLFDLVPALAHPRLRAASRKVRQAGRSGRITVVQDGARHTFDPLPSGPGKRRSYLLRVLPAS